MDIPNPPEEPEVKNIIDKLANFVARNGTEFEKMTKEKQKGNSKFAFLFGGKHYHYYQYKLSTEQQNQNQQKASLAAQQVMAQEAMVQQSLQNAPWQQHQPPMQPPMGGFQQYNQPPLQMPIRMPPMPPNMPPWQQNQPMSKQPPMSMPSFPPPSNSNNMVGQNSAQSFMNIPPPAILNPNMLQQPPPHMQLQQNFPPNMFQPHQGNPPQKHPIPPLMQQTLDPSIVRDSEKKPEDPIKEGEEKLRSAIEDAEKKIEDSKNNLAQQYQVLMQQQQEKIEIAIIQAQDMKLSKLAGATGVIVNDFDTVLHPIINACTKDSISVGKSWILSNSKTASHCDVVGLHLLKKIMDAEKLPEDESLGTKSKFNTQLHIIYLINDVLHHASRKHLVDLSCSLQKVILPIFCMATANAPEAKKERLTKLLTLWDKFQYFNRDILHKLKDPSSSLSEYQANLIIEHADRVKEVQTDIQKQYNQYQQQHDEYAAHVNQQVENQKVALEKLKKEAEQARIEKENEKEANATSNNQRGFGNFEGNEPPWNSSGNFDMPIQFEYGHGSSNQGPPEVIDYSHQRGPRAPWQGGQEGPPWSSGNAPGPRGPPQRGPPVIDPNDPSLIPSAPYYDLPAGLMCPLVKLEEMEYRPLDPTLIRLPPPLPPSDRLLAAVEAFYGPPSHERPRNVDGWEHNGLFEFYRAKVRAKRRKEGGKVSRSPSRSKSRSKSRTPPRSRKRSISRSRSRSSSSGRSRSRSRSASSRSHSRSRSRSKSQSRSPRRRSPDDISRGRSATPPSLSSSFFNLARDQDNKLGEQNRGAQMLKKMGWSGAGLGANEQGIEDPIQAGEVREKYDQFKGLGMAVNDPYENFRKSKSQGFITRIRSRDKERDKNDTPSKRKNED